MYKNTYKGRDEVMNHISSNMLSTWVNVVAGGIPLYRERRVCPLCGHFDSVRHAYQTCEHVKNKNILPTSLNCEEKTEAHKHIRETLRHEAVHIAQYCNKNKTINSLNDKSYQLNDYRKKLALLSTKVSGQREKEIEAYWMESKPYKVKDAIEKYCL